MRNKYTILFIAGIMVSSIFLIVPDSIVKSEIESSYGGEMGSEDGESYADAICFVKTDVTLGNNSGIGVFLNVDVYMEENRQDHLAYVMFYRIDYYDCCNQEWHPGHPWPVVVSEDVTFDRTHVATTGLGFIAREDRWIPFRLNASCYVHIGGNNFEFDNGDQDGGIWFIDVAEDSNGADNTSSTSIDNCTITFWADTPATYNISGWIGQLSVTSGVAIIVGEEIYCTEMEVTTISETEKTVEEA